MRRSAHIVLAVAVTVLLAVSPYGVRAFRAATLASDEWYNLAANWLATATDKPGPKPVIDRATGKTFDLDEFNGLPNVRALDDMMLAAGVASYDDRLLELNGEYSPKLELYRFYPEYSMIMVASYWTTSERAWRYSAYHPAVIEELLGFAAQDRTELNDGTPVYGTSYELDGRRVLPFVLRSYGKLVVGLADDPAHREWPPGTRFLMVDCECDESLASNEEKQRADWLFRITLLRKYRQIEAIRAVHGAISPDDVQRILNE